MAIDFGREVLGDLSVVSKREWLVTNGIGGFAGGTLANVLSRRYHGLLLAALQPPLGRTLLLAKLDETVEYDGIYPDSGRLTPLYLNRWEDGTVEGNGHHPFESGHKERRCRYRRQTFRRRSQLRGQVPAGRRRELGSTR